MGVIWKDKDGALVPVLEGSRKEVGWAPMPGSQHEFLSCPILEVLYEGTRGPGKTDTLLMDFARHTGKGFGAEWRGVLFRRTYPELQDVIAKSQKWVPRMFPAAKYNQTGHVWTFQDGEQLLLRYFAKPEDYWAYHGHAYTWIGWDELTAWSGDECYRSMFSCLRSTVPDIPRKVRATTNPYGPGHNWVKARWRLPIAPGKVSGPVIRDSVGPDGKPEPPRVAIRGRLEENIILRYADPGYIDRVRAAARNPAELAAWVEGSWDIVAGGMFDDVWAPEVHVVPDFPHAAVPLGWRVDRSYDHGQSRPFSVGWWAESNGEPLVVEDRVYGQRRGDLYRIGEWYGWTGKPNEGLRMDHVAIAKGILEREAAWGIAGRVEPGAADTQIFSPYNARKSVAGDMEAMGVKWRRADKGPGSRKQGWEQIRKMLEAAKDPMRETPGLFVLERCAHFRRTMPVLPRSDRDLDDVDTESEDHVGDEVRYRLRRWDGPEAEIVAPGLVTANGGHVTAEVGRMAAASSNDLPWFGMGVVRG